MLELFRFLLPVIRKSYIRAGFPYRANIAVTKECHSRCVNCKIWQKEKEDSELTLGEFDKIAQKYPYLRWLSLTGGEPTDREDLAQIVASFHRSSPLYLVNFSTNGLNQRKILRASEEIARLGIPRLIVAVSIDGSHEIHDELRGVRGGFRLASNTLASLIQLEKEVNASTSSRTQMKVFAAMTLFQKNYNILDRVLEDLGNVEGFSADRLHLNLAHASPHLYGNIENAPLEFDASIAIRNLLKRRGASVSFQDILERTYQKLAIRYSRTRKAPLPCSALRASFHLNENGVVFPCTIWGEPLGNVRDHGYSLTEILNQSKSQDIQVLAEKRNCPNCWSPCEAYQTIAMNPIQSLSKSLFSRDLS